MRLRSCALGGLLMLATAGARSATQTLIVSGLGGEPQYEQLFRDQGAAAAAAAHKLLQAESASGGEGAEVGASRVILLAGPDATREAVRREFATLGRTLQPQDLFTLLLLGHGSFDGEEYRFNIAGPDITGGELRALLDALPARRQLIVNASSSSGAVAELWSRPQRILITATRSGTERNATRFGAQWIQALTAAEADIDKNGLITASEAYAHAQRKVADSFKTQVALATEHSRIAGDGAAQFVTATLTAAPVFAPDAQLNSLLAQRGAIELDFEAVKDRKPQRATDAYYTELEAVLVRLALLQRQIDTRRAALTSSADKTQKASP